MSVGKELIKLAERRCSLNEIYLLTTDNCRMQKSRNRYSFDYKIRPREGKTKSKSRRQAAGENERKPCLFYYNWRSGNSSLKKFNRIRILVLNISSLKMFRRFRNIMLRDHT